MSRRARSPKAQKTTTTTTEEQEARRAVEDERETLRALDDVEDPPERVDTYCATCEHDHCICPKVSRIAPKQTPATPTAVFAALVGAWQRLFGETPSDDSVAVLVSQWALETSWGESCFNFNLGNVPAVDGDGNAFTYYPCWEVVSRAEAHELLKAAGERKDGKPGPDVVIANETDDAAAVVWFYPDHPRCRFRAFSSLEDGAEAYLKTLFHRYKRAWASVLLGSPSGFASDLKALGFFKAPLDGAQGYRTALVGIFNRVQGQLKRSRAGVAA